MTTKPPTTVQDELDGLLALVFAKIPDHHLKPQFEQKTKDALLIWRATAIADAEDKAFDYAVQLFDVTRQWPHYYVKQLDGGQYRKHHKDIGVILGTQAAKPEKDGDA